jgi:hypothetical protein
MNTKRQIQKLQQAPFHVSTASSIHPFITHPLPSLPRTTSPRHGQCSMALRELVQRGEAQEQVLGSLGLAHVRVEHDLRSGELSLERLTGGG